MESLIITPKSSGYISNQTGKSEIRRVTLEKLTMKAKSPGHLSNSPGKPAKFLEIAKILLKPLEKFRNR
jgi:hypothetical protein